jgi:hypothetical protein
VACDATPAYLYNDVALDRLAAVAPQARVVAILREPVSRAWSHYWYNRMLGIEGRSFDRVIRAERRDPTNAPKGVGYGYLQCSRYVPRLEALHQRFADEDVLILLFDDLIADPAGTYAAFCRHAGVDDTIAPPDDGRAHNVGRMPRFAWLQWALLRARAGSWPNDLGPRITRWNARPGSYPRIDEATRATVADLLADDLAALPAALGRPLPASWIG